MRFTTGRSVASTMPGVQQGLDQLLRREEWAGTLALPPTALGPYSPQGIKGGPLTPACRVLAGIWGGDAAAPGSDPAAPGPREPEQPKPPPAGVAGPEQVHSWLALPLWAPGEPLRSCNNKPFLFFLPS